MKKNRILNVFSALALLMAGACSDDTLDSGKGIGNLGPDEAGGVFMTVDFKMPNGLEGNGTRSHTIEGGQSSDGVELGQDEENYVTNALVVLASIEKKTVKVEGKDVTLDKYGYIVAGEVRSNHIQTVSNANENIKTFKAAAQLSKTNLTTFYEMYTETVNGLPVTTIPEVYVFVFCNPTKELIDKFANANEDGGMGFGSAEWIDMTCDVIQDDPSRPNTNIGIWGANSFLMNNKHLTTRKLPKRLLDWENYNSYANAFHLSDENRANGQTEAVDNSTNAGATYGPVLVERSVARLDYKDGSIKGDNKYNVLYMAGEDGNINDGSEDRPNQPVVGVELIKMCLVNMGNRFYYLPRVSDNGLMTGQGYDLCGREKRWENNQLGIPTGGNYVVGPWAEYFKDAAEMEVPGFFNNIFEPQVPATDAKGFYKFFNYPFFDEKGSYDPEGSANRWDVVKIEKVLQGKNDKYDGKDIDGKEVNDKDRDYKIWRYLTENVIPAGADNQVNGISTGIVFKAKLTDAILDGGDGYKEEIWNKGALQNLANCLNGKTFTYNGKDHTLQGTAKEDPILYYFGGTLYMGWRHIRQAAIQASVTININNQVEINRSTSLYRAVFGDGPIPPRITFGTGADDYAPTVYVKNDGTTINLTDPDWPTGNDYQNTEAYKLYLQSPNYFWSMWARNGKEEASDVTGTGEDTDLGRMRKAITDAGITIYQSAKDDDYGAGYYCYYFYWNRHNDNYKDGTMGPMEFDVVRNNVYKLRVDGIKRLGHPRIPDNDPNSPDPKTPDETDYIYLDVKIDVVPWVVRINKIIFDNNY